MSELEQRLRDAVVRRSDGFEPSPDLVDHITARVHRRHLHRRVLAGGLLAAAAAVAVVVGVITTGGEDDGSIRMSDRDVVGTTVPGKAKTTDTTDTTAATTTTAPPTSPTGPAIDELTPLSRSGIGPITSGMTVREAQEAARATIVPREPRASGCIEADIEGLASSPVLVIEPVGADPMDGVVRSVFGPFTHTEHGIAAGSSRAEVVAALGGPTRTQDESAALGAGAELAVFESGGYAYGVLFTGDQVLSLHSGDPDWFNATEGCPS